jgi:hypothetical protein
MTLKISTVVNVINSEYKNKKAFSEQYLDPENELLLLKNRNTFRLNYRKNVSYNEKVNDFINPTKHK